MINQAYFLFKLKIGLFVLFLCVINERRNIIMAKNYKHLSLEERVLIEDRLNFQKSIRSIAKELGKSPSTILREIRNHSVIIKEEFTDCLNRKDCNYRRLCGKTDCKKLCSRCSIPCRKFCTDYVKAFCDKLTESPYVCNGCSNLNLCRRERNLYRANKAEQLYREELTVSRAGFDITEKELNTINELASPMLKHGLSPYHVKQTYGEKLPISESTLRRMIDSNELDARNIDLRDKVKRRPRKTTNNTIRNKTLTAQKLGHLYKDYLQYIEDNDVFITEMDCVEGIKEEDPVLLTLTFKSLSVQLAFIMEHQTTQCVVDTLNKIEFSLGKELFASIFQLIITDNGTEFTDIAGMETSCFDNSKRTKIYFCEPNRSDQKGTCENHHKMIRYVIPKGTPLSPYTQIQISLMMNHINSYKRKALFGKSAYEIAKTVLPEDFFILLGLEEIPAEEIVLKPSLLRNRS